MRSWWRFVCCLVFAANAGGTTLESVRGTSLRVHPAEAFHLVGVLRGLGDAEGADLLARYLLHAFVAALEGREPAADVRVEAAIGDARTLPPLERAVDLRMRWSAEVARVLAVDGPKQPRRLPLELDSMAPQLSELAPGLWVAMQGGRPRVVYLAVTAVNRGGLPLPVTEFELEGSDRVAGEPIKFRCVPEGDAPRSLLLPHEQVAFLCRTFAIPAAEADVDPIVLAERVRVSPAAAHLKVRQLDSRSGVEHTVRALATLHQAEARALLADRPVAHAADTGPAARTNAAPPGPQRHRLVYLLLGAAAALAAYGVLARGVGNGVAATLVGVVGSIYALTQVLEGGLGRSADLWGAGLAQILVLAAALIGPPTAAVAMAAVYAAGARFANDERPLREKARAALLSIAAFILLVFLSLDD